MLKHFFILLLLVSCSTNKKTPSQKYYYTHATKDNTEFYKDETDCAAKAGQATPGLAHRVSKTGYYGQDLSTSLAVSADNQEEQYQYNLLVQQYENIKRRCMLGNGWLLEPLEDYNKRIQKNQEQEQTSVKD